MISCKITEQSGMTWLSIDGRIDGMTSPVVQNHINDLVQAGKRLILANFENVNYISSAGLRIFIMAQKQLKKVDGEIVLYRISDLVMPVFKTSGFDHIFRILSTEEELSDAFLVIEDSATISVTTEDEITFKYKEKSDSMAGSIRVIGSQQKLSTVEYTEDDVVTVSQSELKFGTGLATIGEHYQEYRQLFGEAIIIHQNFYFYPAVKRPAVDYMLYSGGDTTTNCRFFHGFGFDGNYRFVAVFEATSKVSLDRLVQWVLSLPSNAPVLGIVFLAESKGVFGMNLKQVPFLENKPSDGRDIFHAEHFASWMNFPTDPTDDNNIIAGVGIVCRDKDACTTGVQKLFSQGSNFHIHAGIFEKGPISKNIDLFSDELNRVLKELEIYKVQHLLGQSKFSNGILGIIELKG